MEIVSFVRKNLPLCIGTCGLAVIAYSGYRSICWIVHQCQKVTLIHRVAQCTFSTQRVPKGWITPQQQLDRLETPWTASIVNLSLLKKLPLEIVLKITRFVTAGPCPLTHWYTALSRLQCLPVAIPPLPDRIDQMLNDPCPIYAHYTKQDGSHYKISETHILTLIPQELGTLNQLTDRILTPYAQHQASNNTLPLRFRYFWREAYEEHGNIPFGATHWELMTKTIIPHSQHQSYAIQLQRIALLNEQFSVHYEAPSLQGTVAALFLHQVATGERVLPSGEIPHHPNSLYTRVQETTLGWRLIVGAFSQHGLCIKDGYGSFNDLIGMAASIRL